MRHFRRQSPEAEAPGFMRQVAHEMSYGSIPRRAEVGRRLDYYHIDHILTIKSLFFMARFVIHVACGFLF